MFGGLPALDSWAGLSGRTVSGFMITASEDPITMRGEFVEEWG